MNEVTKMLTHDCSGYPSPYGYSFYRKLSDREQKLSRAKNKAERQRKKRGRK